MPQVHGARGCTSPSACPSRATPARVRVGRVRAMTVIVLFLIASGSTLPVAKAATAAEWALHAMINETRVARGVSPLRISDRLSLVAHRHSAEMASRRALFHSSCLPCEIDGRWRKLGENIGVGVDYGQVHEALMDSAPHQRHILDPRYRRVGVGIVRRGGRVWVTEIFYA
jgi:uncharacterized protein YkwD